MAKRSVRSPADAFWLTAELAEADALISWIFRTREIYGPFTEEIHEAIERHKYRKAA